MAKIFETFIEISPKSFLDWVHIELAELYPGSFSYQTNGIQAITFASGEVVPPSEESPFYTYQIFATDWMFSDKANEPSKKQEVTKKDGETIVSTIDCDEVDLGVIAWIEIRHWLENNYHVICYCETEHPQIMKWLRNLEERIKVLQGLGVQSSPIPESPTDATKPESPTSTAQTTKNITNINVQGDIGGDIIVGDDNSIEH
jgi:hypothetical protein